MCLSNAADVSILSPSQFLSISIKKSHRSGEFMVQALSLSSKPGDQNQPTNKNRPKDGGNTTINFGKTYYNTKSTSCQRMRISLRKWNYYELAVIKGRSYLNIPNSVTATDKVSHRVLHTLETVFPFPFPYKRITRKWPSYKAMSALLKTWGQTCLGIKQVFLFVL